MDPPAPVENRRTPILAFRGNSGVSNFARVLNYSVILSEASISFYEIQA